MEIILKQDIPNLGYKDDVISVKDGYGRNYLIPQGMAIVASGSALKVMKENKKQKAHKEAKLKAEAEELAKKLEKVKIIIGAKTSAKGKIFGSVNNIQIAEALEKEGFELDRRNIVVNEKLVKEVGTYTATIKLHRDVTAEVEFEVVSE